MLERPRFQPPHPERLQEARPRNDAENMPSAEDITEAFDNTYITQDAAFVQRELSEAERLFLQKPDRLLEALRQDEPPVERLVFPEPRQPHPEVQQLAELTQEKDDNEVVPEYRTFLQRVAQSKIGKALFGIGGLIGAGKSLDFGVHEVREMSDAHEAREAIHAEIQDSLLEQTIDQQKAFFSNLTDMKEVLDLGDGDRSTRQDLLHTLSDSYTDHILNPSTEGLTDDQVAFNKTIARGKFHIIEGTIGSTVSDDGSEVLDVRRTFDAYGNQLGMAKNKEFVAALSAITDYSPDELLAHAGIMRTSVLETPDIRMGSFSGMQYFDSDQYSQLYAQDKEHDMENRYAFADDFSMAVLQHVDIDAHPELKDDAIKATQEAIRAVIQLENQWTQVGTALEGWNRHYLVQEHFMQETTSRDGQHFDAGIDRFRETEERAELSLKKLAALEKDPQGPLHQMTGALIEAQHDKAKGIFSEAVKLDKVTAPFFKQELQRYE